MPSYLAFVIVQQTGFQGPTDAKCTHAVMTRSSRPRVAGLLAGAAVTVLPEAASCGTRRPGSRTPFREPG